MNDDQTHVYRPLEHLTPWTVLTRRECGEWLRVSSSQFERLDIEPSFWCGKRSPRYVVQDILRRRRSPRR